VLLASAGPGYNLPALSNLSCFLPPSVRMNHHPWALHLVGVPPPIVNPSIGELHDACRDSVMSRHAISRGERQLPAHLHPASRFSTSSIASPRASQKNHSNLARHSPTPPLGFLPYPAYLTRAQGPKILAAISHLQPPAAQALGECRQGPERRNYQDSMSYQYLHALHTTLAFVSCDCDSPLFVWL
jgi:hypothetical protein